MFIDTHTHFDIILQNNKISENIILNTMKENSIDHAVQVAIDADNLEWSYNFAKKNIQNGIYCTLGIHPNARATDAELQKLFKTLEHVKKENNLSLLFGVGECGLDYYRMKQPETMQKNSFITQIELSNDLNKPVIIHSRNAMKDTLTILKEIPPKMGIMHCFPGDSEDAKAALDLGLYISFAGNVTYKNATELHDSASYVPLDRILFETDAPFLTPVPFRGKKNRPEYVQHTYAFVAELKKISLDTLKDAVSANFSKLVQ